jgi:RNA 2',3'-cyclic 3'-phosphodiesterase
MRLFTAIDIPPGVLGNVATLLERLKPAARIKWSPPSNLHITTKFIGEWPEQRLAELQEALATLPARAPVEIAIRNVGFFPNPHSPRVFWAGIEAPPELAALARDTDHALAKLGVAAEPRAFAPHLTLARIKEPVPLQKLRETIAALDSLDFGSFTADRFCLYHSRMQQAGSVYTKLSEFLLSP